MEIWKRGCPWWIVAGLAAAACGGPTDMVAVASMDIVSGGGQIAPPGAVLPQPLVFRVDASTGAPIAGETVDFQVTAGGGTVSPASAVSDAKGLVSVTWTLGPLMELQTMEARVAGATVGGAPVVVTQGATTFLPSVTVVSGGGQTAPVGTHLQPVVFLLLDPANAPVPGFMFTLRSLGCTLQNGLDCFSNQGNDQLTNPTLTSGTDGRATFTGWTLGPTIGPKCLGFYPGTAPPRSSSDIGTLVVCATAVGGPVTQLLVVSADGTAVISVEVALRDQGGNAVDGVPVTFTPSAGGSVSPGVDTSRHVPSDGDGEAFTTWTLGGGANTLTITAAGLTAMISK
jgi:hypothetical protein